MGFQQVFRGGVTALAGAGGAAVVILGIAGVSWRSQCANAADSSLCGGPPGEAQVFDEVVTGSIGTTLGVEVEGPQLPANDAQSREAARYARLIADTFQVLDSANMVAVERTLPAKAPPELVTRKVALVAVANDGRPLWQRDTTATVQDEARIVRASVPVPSEVEPAVPAAMPARSTEVQELPEVTVAPVPAERSKSASIEAPSSKPAPKADVRTVRGQGVNVRSGPTSSGSKLFALKGGTKVTVTETRKGWLHIKDDRGRRGWLYSRYVK